MVCVVCWLNNHKTLGIASQQLKKAPHTAKTLFHSILIIFGSVEHYCDVWNDPGSLKDIAQAIPSVITICLVESPESSSLVFMSIIKWLKIEMTYKCVKNTVRNQNDNKKLMHRRPSPSSPLDNASDDSELCCDTNNRRGFCVFSCLIKSLVVARQEMLMRSRLLGT